MYSSYPVSSLLFSCGEMTYWHTHSPFIYNFGFAIGLLLPGIIDQCEADWTANKYGSAGFAILALMLLKAFLSVRPSLPPSKALCFIIFHICFFLPPFLSFFPSLLFSFQMIFSQTTNLFVHPIRDSAARDRRTDRRAGGRASEL